MKSSRLLFIVMILSLIFLASCSDENPTQTPTVTSIDVSPRIAYVVKGLTHQFDAVVIGNNNPSQSVNWTVTGCNSNSYFRF